MSIKMKCICKKEFVDTGYGRLRFMEGDMYEYRIDGYILKVEVDDRYGMPIIFSVDDFNYRFISMEVYRETIINEIIDE